MPRNIEFKLIDFEKTKFKSIDFEKTKFKFTKNSRVDSNSLRCESFNFNFTYFEIKGPMQSLSL